MRNSVLLVLVALSASCLCMPDLDDDDVLLEELVRDLAELEEGLEQRQPKKAAAFEKPRPLPVKEIIDPCIDHDCCDNRVATVDLTGKGKFTPGPAGVTQDRAFALGPGKGKCNLNTRIKVNFEKFTEEPCDACMSTPFVGRRMLKIELELAKVVSGGPSTRSGYLFSIGDSESNDGYDT